MAVGTLRCGLTVLWLHCLCVSVLSHQNNLLKLLETKIAQNVFHTRNYAERLSFISYKLQLLLSSVYANEQCFPHMVYKSGQGADRHIACINHLLFKITDNSYGCGISTKSLTVLICLSQFTVYFGHITLKKTMSCGAVKDITILEGCSLLWLLKNMLWGQLAQSKNKLKMNSTL